MKMLKSLAFILTMGAATAAAQGTVSAFTLHSPRYAFDRRLWVYTPPQYAATKAGGYPLLVVFDGEQHLDPSGAPVPKVLDSLLAAGSAPAFVAVFVDDSSAAVRTGELGNSGRFADFMAEELVPWIRARYNVTRDPHRTIVMGSSAGGLGAAWVAFRHPELFGNVLSQSGAFWRGAEGSNSPPYEFLTGQVQAASKRDVIWLLDVGTGETGKVLGGAGPVFIEATRRLRDPLVAKGNRVIYTEVPNGQHAPEFWQPRFPIDLATLVKGWH